MHGQADRTIMVLTLDRETFSVQNQVMEHLRNEWYSKRKIFHFLDVCSTNYKDDKLVLRVSRTPTWTGQYGSSTGLTISLVKQNL